MSVRPAAAFRAALCLLAVLVIASGCDDDPVTPSPPAPAPITSPADLITAFALAIDDGDCERASSLLANEPAANAVFRFTTCAPTDLGETSWGYDEEALILCRLLDPVLPLPGVAPVSPDLWLQSIALTLTPLESFVERPDLYSADGGADGRLDPQRWRATDATYATYFLLDLAGTDYKVEGEANFVVIEDLTKHGSEAGRFLLYEWEDICAGASSIAGQGSDLGRVKAMYRARHCPETVIEALASAYARRDPALLGSLLAHEPGANANYAFVLESPTALGETQWDADEELRIHRRMFAPDRLAPGEPAVAPELWLQAVQISLWMTQSFQEQPDLYSADGGRDGKLDPARWRALGASYGTYLFLDLEGVGYKVEAGARFVVIEDRAKQKGEEGKFLLYTWDDREVLGPGATLAGVSRTTWSNLKALYR